MTRVSEHFRLGSGPFEFVDVHVERDSALFIDPSAIRRGRDRYSTRGSRLLIGFFTEVLRCARSNVRADQAKGLELLQALHEPNETRLGYSTKGARGHAFGDGMGRELWDAIVQNRVTRIGVGGSTTIRHAVMRRLEHVPLFIPRVDKDLISDLSTRVAFDVLADFTADMMTRYPPLAGAAGQHTRDVWDPRRKSMRPMTYDLPVASGSPLLLVPRPWIESRLIMNATAFYNRFATQVIQDETARGGRRGSRQSKQSIKRAHPDVKQTNTTQAARSAAEHDRDLVDEYRAWTDTNVDLISDDRVEQSLS